jgi:hypothetical protein
MKIKWHTLDSSSEHKLISITKELIHNDFFIRIDIGPKNNIGAEYFRLFIEKKDLISETPVIFGLCNFGKYPGNNWIEVLQYNNEIKFHDEFLLTINEEAELEIFEKLGSIIPLGGHMMIEYESQIRRLTARSLLVGVPPDATPIGRLLYFSGCGYAIRDWYIPEGGREGSRKLQGFKPMDQNHQLTNVKKQMIILNNYLSSDNDIEWDIKGYTRPIAEQAYNFLSDIIKNGK